MSKFVSSSQINVNINDLWLGLHSQIMHSKCDHETSQLMHNWLDSLPDPNFTKNVYFKQFKNV